MIHTIMSPESFYPRFGAFPRRCEHRRALRTTGRSRWGTQHFSPPGRGDPMFQSFGAGWFQLQILENCLHIPWEMPDLNLKLIWIYLNPLDQNLVPCSENVLHSLMTIPTKGWWQDHEILGPQTKGPEPHRRRPTRRPAFSGKNWPRWSQMAFGDYFLRALWCWMYWSWLKFIEWSLLNEHINIMN